MCLAKGSPWLEERAEVAEWQTRYVQGVVFERTCGFNSHPRHQSIGACSSVGLERSPAKAEVVGSSPPRRASGRLAQRFRASVLHTEGHRFKSCTAHHLLPVAPLQGVHPGARKALLPLPHAACLTNWVSLGRIP